MPPAFKPTGKQRLVAKYKLGRARARALKEYEQAGSTGASLADPPVSSIAKSSMKRSKINAAAAARRKFEASQFDAVAARQAEIAVHEQQMREREESHKRRQRHSEDSRKRTKRGQPILGLAVERYLEKMQRT